MNNKYMFDRYTPKKKKYLRIRIIVYLLVYQHLKGATPK